MPFFLVSFQQIKLMLFFSVHVSIIESAIDCGVLPIVVPPFAFSVGVAFGIEGLLLEVFAADDLPRPRKACGVGVHTGGLTS